MSTGGAPTLADVRAARERIAPLVRPSPTLHSTPLTDLLGVDTWLKLENVRPPGSFKVRGAANKLLSLNDEERRRGVVASSAGNHGAAVAYVAGILGIPATICVPETTGPVKLEAIRAAGAEAIVRGATFDDAVAVADEVQRARGLVPVHPFDDPDVIAGQGTIGLEILEAVPGCSAVALAVSGGGLAGGVGLALQTSEHPVDLVGVSAERAAAMAASVRASRPVDVPEEPTLAEVLSGGIGADNRYTLALVTRLVGEHVSVTEDEIAAAMRFAFLRHHVVTEGGGSVAIAAALAAKLPPLRGPVVLVVSGGNVDPAQLWEVLGRSP
ncbi:MAG TPA: pyridoxal-phosphate dependent enzyme [Actinomycetota bacterium]|nr:pyridoxal-phosphate dependent enzyme [Actinomycetota bacterium]